MTWPFAPRSTLDALVRANDALSTGLTGLMSERDYLRGQLDKALDHNRRLERTQAGLTEMVREPKAAVVIPPELRKILGAFGSTVTQQAMETQVRRALERGESPEEIEAFLLAGLNEQ